MTVAAAAAAALLGWRWNVHNHRRNRRWRIGIRLVEERHGMCRWANNVAWHVHVGRRWLNVVWNCTMHNRCCCRSHSIAIKIDRFQGRHAAVTQGDTQRPVQGTENEGVGEDYETSSFRWCAKPDVSSVLSSRRYCLSLSPRAGRLLDPYPSPGTGEKSPETKAFHFMSRNIFLGN